MQSNDELHLEQYLLFILDDETYAVKAENVQEIVDYSPIKKVPGSNEVIKGITNIRGDLIPIIDPKLRLEIGEVEIKKRTSFIIFKLFNEIKHKDIFIGILVDLVIEVEEFNNEVILETPEFGTKIPTEFIESLVRYEDDYLTVLNIKELLDIDYLSKSKE